jgi:hypothetical protein
MTKINNFRAIAPVAAAALATSLLMMTNLLGDPARASTLEATLVGAGDIASCSHHRDRATANVVGNVQGTVFTLGDNVYPDGTAAQFRDCYDPTWGKYKGRTMPSVGNHEYHTQDASGYFGYFGARTGAPSKGYYSYKRGSWRVVVLNSNCSEVVGGCGAHSPQGRWLEQILTNYPSRCTLAYFHHPLRDVAESGRGEHPHEAGRARRGGQESIRSAESTSTGRHEIMTEDIQKGMIAA